MMLHQEMPQFMRDGEPGAARSTFIVGQNGSHAATAIREQHALEPVQIIDPDLRDIQGPGDFRNRDGQHNLAELRMHRPGQGTGLVKVQKVDAVERQNSARLAGPHFEGLDHVLDNGAIPIRKVFELAVKSSDLQ